MSTVRVRDYMTRAPHTLATRATYAEAGHTMRELGIRHLPVIDDAGAPMAVVEESDVTLLAALNADFPATTRVGYVRAHAPYATHPDARLVDVAHDLMANKQSCAVVLDEGKVVGVFTLVDALRALVDRLS